MTDRLIKALAFDGQVRVFVLDAKQTVQEAKERHQTWHTATAALGRSLAATALLAANLKGQERVSVEVIGSGPLGRIVTDGDSQGNVRGFVNNPKVALELNSQGKLDVAGAVGLPGSLVVRKHMGSGEPFAGQVPLVSGELAEDFTYYMAVSEQTPSAIGLSVLVNADESVAAAGGFMLQMMPGADDLLVDLLEARIKELGRFSDLLESQKTLEELLDLLVGPGNAQVLEEIPVSFHCPCDKERFAKGIRSIGKEEIQAMIDEDHGAEVVCHFCGDRFTFSEDELSQLVAEIDQQRTEASEE
ncbi:Hsp33 family molecular chaperone HslO [Vaginisenegalia massiliensis]|uniref:Hsp33 family molecular chaperone HslO n=1 Tax=Vaginisenegalia massiliensis TaxID=2058294 RepID=UPI000F536D2D|nr:Hsp33 family molecular chaperone HslO [Vaginisenegalia massiliensis]